MAAVARGEVPQFKRFLYANRKMNDAGVGSHIDLPRTVVVGNQSSGKSSLLTVLSGVELPRSSNTCTRHPTELRLENCQECVPFSGTLKIRWGAEKGSEDRERWDKNELGIEFDEYEEDFCEGGCIAIFSREAIAETISNVTRRLLGDNPSGFSDSVVVLHVVDSSVNDFEVIDTPGVVEAGFTPAEIAWLKNMVAGYMKEENTIIMVAMECSGDLSNQKMLDFVKEADPSQQRTLLVLTKADLIQESDEDRWINIVLGKGDWAEYARVHGAHAVRSLTPKELSEGISEEDRISNEKMFFQKSMWQSVPPDRVGTWGLRERLGRLLGELLRKCLPSLLQKVLIEKDQATKKLSQLQTEVPSDIPGRNRYLTKVLMEFCEEVEKVFALRRSDDVGDFDQFYASVAACHRKFVSSLKATQPPVKSDPALGETEKVKYIEKVKSLVIRSQGRLLPDVISNEVRPKIIKECVLQWGGLAQKLLDDIFQLLHVKVLKVAEDRTATLPNLRLALRKECCRLMDHAKGEALKQIQEFSQMESAPFTLSPQYLTSLKQDSADEDGGAKIDDEKVLELISSACRYLEIAFQRYGDNVPMAIDRHLFRQFLKNIKTELFAALAYKPRDEMEKLLCENWEIREKRVALKHKAEALEVAENVLEELSM